MNKSEDITELAKALVKFQAKGVHIPKDSFNPYFKKNYADLSDIIKAIRPAMEECGLAVTQLNRSYDEGTPGVETVLMHTSGQWISHAMEIKPDKLTPQGVGAAITYARRYGLSAILGIAADEDDDGNAASGNTTTGKQGATTAKPPKVDLSDNCKKLCASIAKAETEVHLMTIALEIENTDLTQAELVTLRGKYNNKRKEVTAQ